MSSLPPKGSSGDLSSVDVAVLCGGLGTRLRSVLGEVPKILAPVAGQPFLDHLLRWLSQHGARRVVLCLGVRADLVLEHLAQHKVSGLEVITSIEPKPLGTAGALRLAVPLLRSDPVLVMNGDTFIDADLGAFVGAHRTAKSQASVLCASVPSTARYGRLEIADSRIQRFAEKDPDATGPGAINAGLYLFSRKWLTAFVQGSGDSLERDVFAAAPAGTFAAIPAGEATFLDIGTPDSFAQTETVLARAGLLQKGAA